MKKNRFTLIEIMFVVGILVILIGIGGIAGSKAIRKQMEVQTKAEITMLKAAVRQYKTRWGEYPVQTSDTKFSFAEYLSKVSPTSSTWTGVRPMYIDYKSSNMAISNDNYNIVNAISTKVLDPYEQCYYYLTDNVDGVAVRFLIYSVGRDGDQVNSDPDDPYSSVTEYEADNDSGSNEDNITSNNVK